MCAGWQGKFRITHNKLPRRFPRQNLNAMSRSKCGAEAPRALVQAPDLPDFDKQIVGRLCLVTIDAEDERRVERESEKNKGK